MLIRQEIISSQEIRMQKFHECLNNQLLTLCQQAFQLDEWTKMVNEFLPSSLKGHCFVSSFSKGKMVISIKEVILATELRYFLPELRDLLRKNGQVYQLVSLGIRLYPDNSSLQNTMPLKEEKKTLSLSTRTILRAASIGCAYEPLKEAWQRLAD